MRLTTWTIAFLAAGAVSLAACSSDESDVAVPIIEVTEDVAFYPACGNETLDHGGVRWYVVATASDTPEIEAQLERIESTEREPSPVGRPRSFARVVAPGPGDAIGTLVVWADGVARWVSDSGDLDVWLVDDELAYPWVC